VTARAGSEPVLSADLLARTLCKLDLTSEITLDRLGLNRLYAAFSKNVPNDNIQKRIWLVGDRTRPMTGGDPIEFFDNWLAHGTGGTCYPANGALYALLRATGFDARRISGSVLMEGIEQGGNHGSVLVRLDGKDYLVDAQLAAFTALPLVPGQSTSTGNGIHDISAVPTAEGFDVQWYPGSNRLRPLVMRPELDMGPVDHNYFLAQYALSVSLYRRRSPFNEALFIARHFSESILVVSRNNKTEVFSDNVAIKSEITANERVRILIEELGISEHTVNAISTDEPPGS
jgi:N-hydroxyarylamine O-acetyltransferase